MGEIAQAFVRIRPDMRGFKAETEAGVKGAFSDAFRTAGKIAGGALAAAGLAEAIKSIAEAASSHEAAFAVLDQTLKNAGLSAKGFSANLQDILEKEARLKGFSAEALASSMVRLVSVTKNVGRAMSDLREAEDLARARHIDLAAAALALSKAEQGSTTALQRYGIIIPKVGKNVSELKKEHDDAAASGVKFTGVLKEQYTASLAAATAADTAARRVEAFRIINERFGGSAATFANTAAGQFARLREDIHQAEIGIGTALLPTLAGAAEGLQHFFQGLSTNEGLKQGIGQSLHDIGQSIEFIADAAKVAGPVIGAMAHDAANLVGAIGAPALLTALATYKGIGIALTIAQAAQARYIAIASRGAGVAVADAAAKGVDTAATTALSAAIEGLTLAMGTNAVASAASIASARLATAGVSTFAVAAAPLGEEVLPAATLGLGAFAAGLGAVALSTVTGVAAVAALAGGIAYLATRESDAERANRALKSSIDDLDKGLQTSADLRQHLADVTASVPTDIAAINQAKLNVAMDKNALATTTAAHSSFAYQQLVVDLQRDTGTLAQSLNSLSRDQTDAAKTASDLGKQNVVNAGGYKDLLDRIAKVRDAAKIANETGPFKNLLPESGPQRLKEFQGSLSDFAKSLESIKGIDTPRLKNAVDLLLTYATSVGHLPTNKEIAIALSFKSPTATIDDFLRALDSEGKTKGAVGGHAAGLAYSLAFADGMLAGKPAVSSALADLIPNAGPRANGGTTTTPFGGPGSFQNLLTRSTGGPVPGSGTTDSVPALLTPQEIVFNEGQQRTLRRMLGLSQYGSAVELFKFVDNDAAYQARHVKSGADTVQAFQSGGVVGSSSGAGMSEETNRRQAYLRITRGIASGQINPVAGNDMLRRLGYVGGIYHPQQGSLPSFGRIAHDVAAFALLPGASSGFVDAQGRPIDAGPNADTRAHPFQHFFKGLSGFTPGQFGALVHHPLRWAAENRRKVESGQGGFTPNDWIALAAGLGAGSSAARGAEARAGVFSLGADSNTRRLRELSASGRPFYVPWRDRDLLPREGFAYHATMTEDSARSIVASNRLLATSAERSGGFGAPPGAFATSDPSGYYGRYVVAIPNRLVRGQLPESRFGIRHSPQDVLFRSQLRRQAAIAGSRALSDKEFQIFGEFEPKQEIFPDAFAAYRKLGFRGQVAEGRSRFAGAEPEIRAVADALGLSISDVRPGSGFWRGQRNFGYGVHVPAPGRLTNDFENRLRALSSTIGAEFQQGSLSYGRPSLRGAHPGLLWDASGKNPAAAQDWFDKQFGEGVVGMLHSPVRHGYYVVNFGADQKGFNAGLGHLGIDGPRLSWEGSYVHDNRLPGYGMEGVKTFQQSIAKIPEPLRGQVAKRLNDTVIAGAGAPNFFRDLLPFARSKGMPDLPGVPTPVKRELTSLAKATLAGKVPKSFSRDFDQKTLASQLGDIYQAGLASGPKGAAWYDTQNPIVQQFAKREGISVEQAAQVLSIYSARTEPNENMIRAAAVIRQAKQLGSITSYEGQKATAASRILRGEPWQFTKTNQKTSSYFQNLLQPGFPKGQFAAMGFDPTAVTNDRWVAAQFRPHLSAADRVISQAEYPIKSELFRGLAPILGLSTPAEAQAAPWVTFKALDLLSSEPNVYPTWEKALRAAQSGYEDGFARSAGPVGPKGAMPLGPVPSANAHLNQLARAGIGAAGGAPARGGLTRAATSARLAEILGDKVDLFRMARGRMPYLVDGRGRFWMGKPGEHHFQVQSRLNLPGSLADYAQGDVNYLFDTQTGHASEMNVRPAIGRFHADKDLALNWPQPPAAAVRKSARQSLRNTPWLFSGGETTTAGLFGAGRFSQGARDFFAARQGAVKEIPSIYKSFWTDAIWPGNEYSLADSVRNSRLGRRSRGESGQAGTGLLAGAALGLGAFGLAGTLVAAARRGNGNQERGGRGSLPLGRYGVGNEIGHDAPFLWTIRGGRGAKNPIPMHSDIGGWLDQFIGNGLSRAQKLDAQRWWAQHWPEQSRYAVGGPVTGSGFGDSVPAMLSPGELILNRAQQLRLGGMLGMGGATAGQLFSKISGSVAHGRMMGGRLQFAGGGVPLPPELGGPADPLRPHAGTFGQIASVTPRIDVDAGSKQLASQITSMLEQAFAMTAGQLKGLSVQDLMKIYLEKAWGASPQTAASYVAGKTTADLQSAFAVLKTSVGTDAARAVADPIGAAIDASIKETTGKLKDLRTAAGQQITGLTSDLTDMRQSLADAVKQEQQDVTDSVNSAKSNLSSIGQSIAQFVSQYLNKPLDDAQTRLSRLQNRNSLDALRQSVMLPGGRQLSTDPQKAVSQLRALAAKGGTNSIALSQFANQYEGATLAVRRDDVTAKTTQITRQFSDLTYALSTGKIKPAAFDRRVEHLLSSNHITERRARQLLGPAAAGVFGEQKSALFDQARAIADAPHRDGSGLGPTVVHPLEVLHRDQEQIHALQKSIGNKQIELQKAIADSTKKTAGLTATLLREQRAKARHQGINDKTPGHTTKTTKHNSGTTG